MSKNFLKNYVFTTYTILSFDNSCNLSFYKGDFIDFNILNAIDKLIINETVYDYTGDLLVCLPKYYIIIIDNIIKVDFKNHSVRLQISIYLKEDI